MSEQYFYGHNKYVDITKYIYSESIKNVIHLFYYQQLFFFNVRNIFMIISKKNRKFSSWRELIVDMSSKIIYPPQINS